MDKSDDLTNFSKVCIHDDRPFKLVLWGDSHGGSIYPGFRELEQQNNQVAVTQFTAAGCGGLLPTEEQGSFCRNANVLALKEILRIKPNLVVIYKAWHPWYFQNTAATLQKFKKENIPVLVIGPTPRWSDDLPRLVYRYWKRYKELPPAYSFNGVSQNLLFFSTSNVDNLSKEFAKEGIRLPEALRQSNFIDGVRESKEPLRSLTQSKFGPYFSANEQICNERGCFIPMKVMDADLRKLVIANGGAYYSAYDRFCNNQGCLNRLSGLDNALTTLDEDHITPAAAKYLVQGLRQEFLEHAISQK
jgi:hypothetical protein